MDLDDELFKEEEWEPRKEKIVDPRFYMFRDAVETDKARAEAMLVEAPSLLEIRNSIGETVLHYLMVEDDRESALWLVERGAKVDTVNDFGDTPLMDAAALGYNELCRYLIEHGANVRFINDEAETSVFSKAVALTPSLAMLKMLLEYTVDLAGGQ